MHRGTRRLHKRSKTKRRHTRRHKRGGSGRRRQLFRGNEERPVLPEYAAAVKGIKELDRFLSIENASNSGQRKMKIERHAREDRDEKEPENRPKRYSSIGKHLRSFKAPKHSKYPNANVKELMIPPSTKEMYVLSRPKKNSDEYYGFPETSPNARAK